MGSWAPRVSMSSLRELVGPEMYDAPVSTTTMQPSSQTKVADLTDTLGEASQRISQQADVTPTGTSLADAHVVEIPLVILGVAASQDDLSSQQVRIPKGKIRAPEDP
ncbi:hypothetical protein VULLAG_LOCUS14453 [Vulpes lagopus]